MISENNLKEMMDSYIKSGEASTKELKEMGFVSIDLTRLVHNKNMLERKERGSYKVNTQELFKYAMSLLEEKKLDQAYSALYRCHLDEKNNMEYIYNLFMISILLDKYDESIKFMNILLNDKNDTYNINNINYYFMLLGLSKKVPEELIDIFKYIRFEDIQLLTGTKEENASINGFRSKVIKFTYRNEEIPGNKDSLEFIVEAKLLNDIYKIQTDEKNKIFSLIKAKKLDELLNYICNDLSYRNLNNAEEYYLKILNNYFEIKRTKKVLVLRSLECSNVWKALDNNNYKAALRLQKEYCESYGIRVEGSSLYLLLLEINQQIDEVIGLNEEKNDNLNETNDSKEISSNSILELLINNEIDNAHSMIKEYLKDNSEFIYLINYLIKISIYEEDPSFSKPMMAIAMIKNNTFNFIISDYILSFYESLAKKEFMIAEVYLDILDKAYEKKHTKYVIKSMRTVLNNAIIDSKDKLKRPNYDFAKKEVKEEHTFEDLNTGLTLLDFEQRGILVINDADLFINNNLEILRKLPNLDYFIIEYNKDKKVVLRYKENENINSQSDVLKLINDANQLYFIGKLDAALTIYKTILKKSYVSNSSLYYRLGEICLSLNQKSLAKDYLMIANSLSKIENLSANINLDEIVKEDSITKEQAESSSQIVVTTEDDERRKEVLKYYGLDIDKVVDLMINSNMSLYDACQSLNMWQEEYYKCALYLAREYYYLGDYKLGDYYFNIVNKLKKRSNSIEDFYKKVKLNKKFYSKTELEGPRLHLK